MIKKQAEIAVIGAGLIGMLSAYMLAKSGKKVIIIEKSTAALESSWAGGGILSPLYPWRYPDTVNVLAAKSQLMYPALVAEIQKISGLDPEYRRCGMHILQDDMDETAYQWLDEHKIEYENTVPPWSTENHRHYLFLPQIAQIRNPRFIKSLTVALEKMGVEIQLNQEVFGFKKKAENDFEISTAKGLLSAEKIVVCAGAWTSRLLGQDLPSVTIKPIRGQMLLYKAPADLISSIVLAMGKYIIPRKDGRILVGSTMEDVGFEKATTEKGRVDLMAFVEDICPVIANYPIEQHWSGLRPGSPDGTPYIGEHPTISGVYINSGHFRNGVVMAPASALLLSDIIQGNQLDIDKSKYMP